jgi:hypothetical protein
VERTDEYLLSLVFSRQTSCQLDSDSECKELSKSFYRQFWTEIMDGTRNPHNTRQAAIDESRAYWEKYFNTISGDKYKLLNLDLTQFDPSNVNNGYSKNDILRYIKTVRMGLKDQFTQLFMRERKEEDPNYSEMGKGTIPEEVEENKEEDNEELNDKDHPNDIDDQNIDLLMKEMTYEGDDKDFLSAMRSLLEIGVDIDRDNKTIDLDDVDLRSLDTLHTNQIIRFFSDYKMMTEESNRLREVLRPLYLNSQKELTAVQKSEMDSNMEDYYQVMFKAKDLLGSKKLLEDKVNSLKIKLPPTEDIKDPKKLPITAPRVLSEAEARLLSLEDLIRLNPDSSYSFKMDEKVRQKVLTEKRSELEKEKKKSGIPSLVGLNR